MLVDWSKISLICSTGASPEVAGDVQNIAAVVGLY